MEPGHEDREYAQFADARRSYRAAPQWSPVMKTGNTGCGAQPPREEKSASMEPGHEDREYPAARVEAASCHVPQWSPVMKTGNTATAA